MKAYITRDKDDQLCLWYGLKPKREEGIWDSWDDKYIGINDDLLPRGCDPNFYDKEPIEVEFNISMSNEDIV